MALPACFSVRFSFRIGLVAALTLGISAALPACSSDDGSSGTGSTPGGGPALDELGPLFLGAVCNNVKSCLGPVSEAFGGDRCVEENTAEFNEASLPTLKAAVESGKATYDASKVNACVAAYGALGCAYQTTRFSDLPACKGVLVGKTAAGGDCTSGNECAEGLYCKVGAACPGKCTAQESEGGGCSSSDHCKGGLVCSGAIGAQTCAKPTAAGSNCGGTTPECVASSICLGEDQAQGIPATCKPISEVFSGSDGGACDFAKTQLCGAGLSCAVTKIDASGAAFACVKKSSSKAACSYAIPSACPAGEYCDGVDLNAQPPKIDGTCKALPAAGEPCNEASGGESCGLGLYCDGAKTCKAPAKNGASCTEARGCLSDRCVGGTCVAADACNEKLARGWRPEAGNSRLPPPGSSLPPGPGPRSPRPNRPPSRSEGTPRGRAGGSRPA